jgi:hypothetical protein
LAHGLPFLHSSFAAFYLCNSISSLRHTHSPCIQKNHSPKQLGA